MLPITNKVANGRLQMSQRLPINVLLVDDHPVVRAGYRRLLEETRDIHVVAEAGDGEQACRCFSEHKPDVMVLDLNMPGIGGLETIRRVLAKTPLARILVFSMYDSDPLIQRAAQAGAKGYLTKASAAVKLVEGIRQVARGEAFFNISPTYKASAHDKSSGYGFLEVLSQREFQIFQLLAEGHTVMEIAELLCISPKTAGVHQTHIIKKLGLTNTAQLTRLAIRSGVIMP